MTPRAVRIRVPASTANLGPGFDALGLALDVYLDVDARLDDDAGTDLAVRVTYDGDAAAVPLDPARNLITATMLGALPRPPPPGSLHVHVANAIPLGRGLGSSGAAVVAGVLLANWVGRCGWSAHAMLEKCVAVEGHPDNVAASLLGGLVACCTASPPSPSLFTMQLPFDEANIRLFAAIPDYHVPTKLARDALPGTYTTGQVVHSLQRVALLTHALGGSALASSEPPLTSSVIRELLNDVVHQPHREHLIPGFTQLRAGVADDPTILGVGVSGAGPTLLVLATRDARLDSVRAHVEAAYAGLPHPQDPARAIAARVLPVHPSRGAECHEVEAE